MPGRRPKCKYDHSSIRGREQVEGIFRQAVITANHGRQNLEGADVPWTEKGRQSGPKGWSLGSFSSGKGVFTPSPWAWRV